MLDYRVFPNSISFIFFFLVCLTPQRIIGRGSGGEGEREERVGNSLVST